MSIFKLSPTTSNFILNTVENNKCRSRAASLALAMVITERMPVSAKDNDVLANEFILSNLDIVASHIPVDINCVRDCASRLLRWKQAVYQPGQLNGIVSEETALVDLFGLRRFFDEATLLAAQKEGVEISQMKLGFHDLLNEVENQA